MRKLFTTLSLILVIGFCFTSCTNSTQLKIAVEAANADCPEEVDTGLILTKVFDNGTSVIYEYDTDENIYDLSEFGAIMNEAKGDIKYELANDEYVIEFLKTLAPEGRSLIYRYVGNQSGETFDIVFSNRELKNMLENK